MSNQLKKKFLGSDSVDGTKIKFGNDDAFRARNQLDTADISLFKLNASNEFELILLPKYNGSNVATESYVDAEVGLVSDDVAHLVTLSGVAVDSDNLGSFSGSTISDSQTVKSALQQLESAHEEVDQNVNDLVSLSGVAENSTHLGVFTGAIIPDSQTVKEALQALETAVEAVSGGGSSTQDELDDTQVGAGLEIDGSYVAPVGSNYLGAAVSLKDADSKLDDAIAAVDSAKVDRAGDTMTGTLIINPASGNAAELGDIIIGEPFGAGLSVISTKSSSSDQLVLQTADKSGTASAASGLFSGNATSANSGAVQVTSGQTVTSGNSGSTSVKSGPAASASGAVVVGSGNAGTSSGVTQVITGTGQSTSPVQIVTGNASAGNSGNILLSTGSATGTRGVVNINAPEMSFQNLGRITNLLDGTSAQHAVTKSQLDAHINNVSDAHDASAISIAAITNIDATDVQGALAEIQGQLDTVAGDFVDVAGDTMTGSLIIDSGVGNSNTLSENTIVITDGVNNSSIAIDDINLNSTDNATFASYANMYSGNLELSNVDLVGGATFDSTVSLSSGTANQITITTANYADQNQGTSTLSQAALDFSFTDNATGVQSTTSFQHNYISILVQDTGAGSSSSFSVDPAVGVSLVANDGTGPVSVAPTQDFHLVPKKYVDDGFIRVDGSNNMMANLDMMDGATHYKIVGLGDPTAPRDAVNKQYVDAVAEGLHVHAPAKAILNSPLSGSVTYDNGVDGVGATLTLGTALTSIDDYTLQDQDRIIINGQANQAHNGIYIWATGGTELTRSSDFDTITEAAGGDFIFIQEGLVYGNSGWVMTETTSSIGSSPIAFIQFSGAGQLLEGDAIDLQGNEINVVVDNSGIEVNVSNQLQLKDSGVVNAKIANLAVDSTKISSDVAGVALEKSLLNGKLDVRTDGISISINGSNQVHIPMNGVDTNEIKNSAVTTDKLLDDAVTAAKINSDVAGIAMEKSLLNDKLDVKTDGIRISVNGSNQLYIPMDGVDTNEIKNSAVTTDKILDDAVTAAKINSDVGGIALEKSLLNDKLDVKTDGVRISVNGSNQLYIPMDGVDTNEIKNSAVTTDKLLDDAVTAAKINSDVGGIALEKSLLNDKLDVKTDGIRIAVNGSNQLYIPMDGVDSNEIKASAVITAKIANDAVDKDKINSDVAGIGLQQDLDGSLAVKLDGTSLSKSASGVKLNIESHKEAYTVQAADDVISSNFYDLDFVAEPNTIIAFVDRVAIHQSLDGGLSDDFTVSATGGVGGVTRITFVNALATPGQQKLAIGDRLYFTYQKKIS